MRRLYVSILSKCGFLFVFLCLYKIQNLFGDFQIVGRCYFEIKKLACDDVDRHPAFVADHRGFGQRLSCFRIKPVKRAQQSADAESLRALSGEQLAAPRHTGDLFAVGGLHDGVVDSHYGVAHVTEFHFADHVADDAAGDERTHSVVDQNDVIFADVVRLAKRVERIEQRAFAVCAAFAQVDARIVPKEFTDLFLRQMQPVAVGADPKLSDLRFGKHRLRRVYKDRRSAQIQKLFWQRSAHTRTAAACKDDSVNRTDVRHIHSPSFQSTDCIVPYIVKSCNHESADADLNPKFIPNGD